MIRRKTKFYFSNLVFISNLKFFLNKRQLDQLFFFLFLFLRLLVFFLFCPIMNLLEDCFKNSRSSQSNEFDEVLLPRQKSKFRPNHIRSWARLVHWTITHKYLSIFLICFCLPLSIYMFLLLFSNTRAFVPQEFQTNQQKYRLLLVVAHPDDECLFFSPTLRVLQRQFHVDLSLLVFSRGNHVGLGEIRAKELHGSCQALQIPRERCISLDLANIQDNPKVWWSEKELLPVINEHISNWNINLVVTFDNQGVSGHVNHRAISYAIRELIEKKNNSLIQMSYELKSVSILRKYSSILDFYLTFISYIPRLLRSLFSCLLPFDLISPPDRTSMLLISTPTDYHAARTAFHSHQTQFSWDRYIYLMASRYMFINELKSIDKTLSS